MRYLCNLWGFHNISWIFVKIKLMSVYFYNPIKITKGFSHFKYLDRPISHENIYRYSFIIYCILHTLIPKIFGRRKLRQKYIRTFFSTVTVNWQNYFIRFMRLLSSRYPRHSKSLNIKACESKLKEKYFKNFQNSKKFSLLSLSLSKFWGLTYVDWDI